MSNYPHLGKKIFRNYLKKMFSNLVPLIKLLYLRRFQIIYKFLIFILLIDLQIDKVNKKSRFFVYAYNNEKKKFCLNIFNKNTKDQSEY